MTCALVKKLRAFSEISDAEAALLERMSARAQPVSARSDIISVLSR